MNHKSYFTIVCLGDSITCNWDSPSYVDYWQELLAKKFGSEQVKVISVGVNGETAQDSYSRLKTDVLSYKPNLVTIMFGHNDLEFGFAPPQFAQNLELIIKDLLQAQIEHIWLLSPNQVWGQANQDRYPQFLRSLDILSQTSHVDFIDVWHHAFSGQNLDTIYTYNFDYAGLTGRDWIHPNETGHRLIAKFLMNKFDDLIKI